MRYLVKQRVHSAGDAYIITAEDGALAYDVRAIPESPGRSFEIHDATGAVIAEIHERVVLMQPIYAISCAGEDLGVVFQDLGTFYPPRFTLRSAAGSFELSSGHSDTKFVVTSNGALVARIDKELSYVASTSTVELLDKTDVIIVLAMVIVLDQALASHKE
jgi:uncharacterized protein YxjI